MRTALLQATNALTRFRSAMTQASSAGNRLRSAARQNSTELQRLRTSAQQAATGVQTAARNAGTSGGLFSRFTGGLRGATTAMRGLNTAMKANVMGMILALILPLITKLIDMAMQSKTVQAVVQSAFRIMGQVMGATMRAGAAAINWVVSAAKNVMTWLKKNWPLLVAILTGPVGIAVLAIVKNWDRIKSAVASVRDWIVNKWNDAVGFLRGIPGRITGVFTGLAGRLRSMGGDIVQGLINGIRGKASAVLSAVRNSIVDKIPGPIRSALGISSPSKLMMGFGRDVGEGLALGIEGTGNRVAGAAGRLATATARSVIGPGYSLAGAAAGRSAPRTGSAVAAPVTVNVHPRPGQSEYEIARITARELAWAGKR
ncbi:phage tail protein [Streptomyces bluensis]|uniref:phage tail protein n=1 Tax=Streptomyces bluensis TaxID=33897 RepID=UPI00331A4E93